MNMRLAWTKFRVIITASLAMVIMICIFCFVEIRSFGERKMTVRIPSVSVDAKSGMYSKEYILEIIGLGVTLDKYRQGALWDAIAKGDPYSTVRDMNPKNYPWDSGDQMTQSGSREGASLENAILDVPRYWGIPAFNAAPRYVGEECEDRPDRPQAGIVRAAGGMHILILAGRELSERPDHILEKIFIFFDQHPSVPFIVLGSADSTYVRTDTVLPHGVITTGHSVPEMPDASAVFVIARRERVDAIRHFVFRDLEEPQPDVNVLNRDGVARRVWLNSLALEKKVPTPPEKTQSSYHYGRQPTGEEWLADLEVFSKQFDPSAPSQAGFKLSDLVSNKPRLSRHWRPKPWFPVPWNTEQLNQFDMLPTLGFLHRPVFVKMTDDNGKKLKNKADREAKLWEGWKDALSTLPAAQRPIAPARVIVATGGKTSQLLDFHSLLRKVNEEGGPKFEPAEANKFVDMDRRLGNTGAATFFMQTAIGILGSYREGGISAVFNLRDPDEASIVFISPPSDQQRKNQQHPIGGDVFQNATIPLVDPKNYEEPVLK